MSRICPVKLHAPTPRTAPFDMRELVELLETVIAEAGDLIESLSPELVTQARAALRHFGDEALREAE